MEDVSLNQPYVNIPVVVPLVLIDTAKNPLDDDKLLAFVWVHPLDVA